MKLWLFLVIGLSVKPCWPTPSLSCGYIPEWEPEKQLCNTMNARTKRDAVIPFIFNGKDAEPGIFKWMAFYSAEWPSGTSGNCGGVLISESVVLTAAHCLQDQDVRAKLRFVSLGAHNIHSLEENVMEVPVDKFVIHEKYNKKGILDNDLAMVFLSGKINFRIFPHIAAICLPPMEESNLTYEKATITGWGFTTQDAQASVLQQGEVEVYDQQICSSIFSKINVGKDIYDPEVMICAGSYNRVSACTGDSGGPAISRRHNQLQHELVGIISWGFGKKGNCASSTSQKTKYATIFTKIAGDRILSWIDNNLMATPVPSRTACRFNSDCWNSDFSQCSSGLCVPAGLMILGGKVGSTELSKKVQVLGNCNVSSKDLTVGTRDNRAELLGHEIYYCGGWGEFDNWKKVAHCYIRDMEGNERVGPSLNVPRYLFSMNSVGNKLVIVGGLGISNARLDTVEVLEPDTSPDWVLQTYKISPGRGNHCGVTISSNSIMLIGGLMKKTEELNILTGSVTPYADLPHSPDAAACTLYKNKIFLTGGWRATVYSLDFRIANSEWEAEPSMIHKRMYHSIGIVKGVLTVHSSYGAGGSSMEEYIDGEWREKPVTIQTFGSPTVQIPC